MEPDDNVFDATHDFLDETGKSMFHANESATKNGVPYRRTHFRPHVHSVLLADGLYLPLDQNEVEDLPKRFETGSTKARLTWFGALCLAGIGMFVDAYIIISIGQIKTIWHSAMPSCFSEGEEAECPNNVNCCDLFSNTPDTCGVGDECNADGSYKDEFLCNESVTAGVSYAQFAGIMLGMLTFGRVADLMGNHIAGMLTTAFQIIGIAAITFYPTSNYNTLFIVFDIFFVVFGFGMGGEYPISATSAASQHVKKMEEAESDDFTKYHMRVLREKERSVRRGENISLVFAMQGMGAVIGSLVLVCLVYFGHQSFVECDVEGSNASGQDFEALESIWRSFFFIGLLFFLMIGVYRALILEHGDGHKHLVARKQRRSAKVSTFKILRFYALRLLGTGGSWLLSDIAFYGLKLFSGPIISEINPEGDLIKLNGYLLVNNVCALFGYYLAARVIDIPTVGRKRLQAASFAVCAVIFLITGIIFNKASPPVLMFLYFLSSFFINFGPHVTAYVMAAETYPTELRGTCHGISAFAGKAGSLFASIYFSNLTPQQIFFFVGGTCIVGLLFTVLFVVDLTHVSLSEHDAQLELFLEGRLDEYKGKLNDPTHLSLCEKVMRKHGEYDPKWALKLLKEAESTLSKESTNDVDDSETKSKNESKCL